MKNSDPIYRKDNSYLTIPRELLSFQRGKGEGSFLFGIDCDLKEPFVVGKGNAFLLKGWCYHTSRKLKRLYAVVDGHPRLVNNHSLARTDVFKARRREVDAGSNSLNSGFWAVLPFLAVESKRDVLLGLRAVLDNGKIHEAEVGSIILEPKVTRKPVPLAENTTSADAPLIAICMATYNPSIRLFERQVDSIIRQSHKNWICIVNDDCSQTEKFEKIRTILKRDKRFRLSSNPANIGVNGNFEKCLSMVPEEALFISIADQDDSWHENKLSVLLSRFDEETSLVYSDMNIVNEKGEIQSNTYWTTRKNNFEELDLLIFANTVTGASCMFRIKLLESILPFPKIDNVYYDNVIACIALAQGRIKYVDRPLYDYYQHPNNVIGHCVTKKSEFNGVFLSFLKKISAKYIKLVIRANFDSYYDHYLRRVALANILKLRCKASGKKMDVIDRFISLETSSKELVFQVLKNAFLCRKDITLGIDNKMLKNILVKRIIQGYFSLTGKYGY